MDVSQTLNTLTFFMHFILRFNITNMFQPIVFLFLLCIYKYAASSNEATEYIVYMGGKGETESGILTASHYEMLKSVLGSEEQVANSMVYTYKYGFSGFSAKLGKQHADAIRAMPNVVSVFPSRRINVHTTRSWEFLGMAETQSKALPVSLPEGTDDVIVGVIDTGLWPESKSFDDTGFGPVPARWKGFCNNTGVKNSSDLFTCTKKIIGGRTYPLSSGVSQQSNRSRFGISSKASAVQPQEYNNARDASGHGSHTSSTATGVDVQGASLFGLAEGQARGGYPKARLAMYKVCWYQGICEESGILAAFDDAINDGVDVISVSLGGPALDYDVDGIAIGAYHAAAHGIVVSCSAGNSGNVPGSVINSAPWILTVGASTIDRKIAAPILLGNNITVIGTGLNIEDPKKSYKVVYAGDYPISGASSFDAGRCIDGSFDKTKLRGNIVLCILDPYVGFSEAAVEGAKGLILAGDFYAELLYTLGIPSSFVHASVGDQIISYINSTKTPTATFLKSTTISKTTPAPVVASFSSRGPNVITPDILKPDVTAPGVNILAAWSEASSVLELNNKTLFSKYNIISGTSMSCPHVSGAAAYVKSVHPDWSPAAIKSALMTTGTLLDNTKAPIRDFDGLKAGPFDYGAGEINPVKATDPGLVYDISPTGYITYLCESGYNTTQVRLITGDRDTTCTTKNSTGPAYLNYPSFAFVNVTHSQSTSRVVTNVGEAHSGYTVTVVAPPSVTLTVSPTTLTFTSLGQKLTYSVTVEPKGKLPKSSWVFGSITWVRGSHTVYSPIAITAGSGISS